MSVPEPRLRRHTPEVAAEDTRRFLQDPNTVRVLESMREELVRAIESTPSDGTPEGDATQLEMNRMLRTLARMRAGMSIKTQLQDLREAGFHGQNPTTDPTTET